MKVNAIIAMDTEAVERIRNLETEAAKLPQVPIATNHVIHAGMYARTVCIPAGVLITGALIRIATVLIISGDTTVFVGTGTTRLTGYHVIPAAALRKQAFYAHTDTHLTMMFHSAASTVEEAEQEFTTEVDLLISRKGNTNTLNAQGLLCQV